MTTIEIKNKEIISLNNTAEEQLRLMLVEKNNDCNALLAQIELLKRNIKEEQDGKYRAYVKISDLQNQIKHLENQKKD
mgnify:FL=1|tara:strand:- start:675 stop:908 length:234 start_codon:yes stop_codon:yes gene_type:complete